MFRFFRAHQKILFFVITAIIIITFSFFGTHSAFDRSYKKQAKDKIVSKTIDGKNIKQSEIESMTYFLIKEEELSSKINLQTSVIQKEFLETKLATTLAKKYFDEFCPLFEERFEKAKRFRPYVHPQVSFISAKSIWSQFSPEIITGLEALDKKTKFDAETFDIFSDLYLGQKRFSPETLKKVLLYQQSQYQWLSPDNRIIQDDMFIFGFNSIVDFFGYDFIDLISQVIINVAAMAEQKGYKVTSDEALLNLIHVSKETLCKKVDLTGENSNDCFRHFLNIFGLNEKMIVDIWKKILLFKNYMNDIGNTVILDNLTQDEISSFNKEKVNVELFRFSNQLHLTNFESFLKLQTYLKALFVDNDSLDLPTKLLSVGEIEKKHPELIEKCYEVKLKRIKLNDIFPSIGEKRLWSWQLEDENYSNLKKEFTQLSNLPDDKEKRFSNLEKLDPIVRLEIDNFSRRKILLSDKKSILHELNNAKEETVKIGIKVKAISPVLKGIDDKKLSSILEKEKIYLKDEALDSLSPLFLYSDNDEDFYRITLLSKARDKSIVSYEDALKEDILDHLLDINLKKRYSQLSEKELSLFKDEKGNIKPFFEAKNQLGSLFFKDILRKLDRVKNELKIKDNSLDSYVTCFLFFNLKKVKEKMENFVPFEQMLSPWKIEKENITVNRFSKDSWLKDLLFSEKTPSTFSEVHIGLQIKDLCFYKFIGKEKDEKATFDEIAKTKKIFSDEAKRTLLGKFLNDLEGKKIIKIKTRNVL